MFCRRKRLEYLAFCEAEGRTTNTPYKGSFNVRLPQELHKRAALYAEEHNRKLNSVVPEALQEFLTNAG
ncbi:MAG TPA: toxin-antitoxin system HicB family antitoxin [Granulicella sp.]|jgi:predicted HicB family RNase H-like nuclease|nr:toxin-antitoxin system HicB family antitoxin [Granulicella sp.]